MGWCGGQPGGDRGGALAAQDKWPLCATFREVRGGKGRVEAANKGCLYPGPPTPQPTHYRPLSLTHYNSRCDLALSQADEGLVCVYGRLCVCVSVCAGGRKVVNE